MLTLQCMTSSSRTRAFAHLLFIKVPTRVESRPSESGDHEPTRRPRRVLAHLPMLSATLTTMMEPLLLAYVLIGIGLVLLLAEMFIPSWGLLFVLAICALVGGVWIVFREDSSAGWVTLA